MFKTCVYHLIATYCDRLAFFEDAILSVFCTLLLPMVAAVRASRSMRPAPFSSSNQARQSLWVPSGCPSCHSITLLTIAFIHGPGCSFIARAIALPCDCSVKAMYSEIEFSHI